MTHCFSFLGVAWAPVSGSAEQQEASHLVLTQMMDQNFRLTQGANTPSLRRLLGDVEADEHNHSALLRLLNTIVERLEGK